MNVYLVLKGLKLTLFRPVSEGGFEGVQTNPPFSASDLKIILAMCESSKFICAHANARTGSQLLLQNLIVSHLL